LEYILIALTTAADPLQVNLMLEMALSSRRYYLLNPILNRVSGRNPPSAFPMKTLSAMARHRFGTEVEEISSAGHPIRIPRLLAQTLCLKEENNLLILWGFT